jgi:diguanylate cyclase (GGDEF)-like protein
VDTLLRIDINIFSIIVAAILAFSMRSRNERGFLDYRLFMLMLWGAIAVLVLDTAMWFSEGVAAPLGRTLLTVETASYYLVHPLTPACFALFAAYRVTGNVRRFRSRIRFLVLPALVCDLMSLASPLTGWFFYIDAAGAYRHGPLFWLFTLLNYCYIAFALAYVLIRSRRASLDARTLGSLVLFPVLASIASLAQVFNYGLVVIWPSIVLSLLVIYVNMQQRKLSSDYLTGAFNRRRLDEYLASRVRDFNEPRLGRPKTFAGFLADIDDFKAINDRFGHAEGDAAIIETVKRIRAGLRSEDFLARYAGDEFVAVLPVSGEAELARIVARVRSRFDGAQGSADQYRLTLSIGSAVFDPSLDADADRFIARLDKLMYDEKMRKKLELRSDI